MFKRKKDGFVNESIFFPFRFNICGYVYINVTKDEFINKSQKTQKNIM